MKYYAIVNVKNEQVLSDGGYNHMKAAYAYWKHSAKLPVQLREYDVCDNITILGNTAHNNIIRNLNANKQYTIVEE